MYKMLLPFTPRVNSDSMAPHPTPKIRRVRAQLTATQRAHQRARREALADDIDTAKESYEAEAADIAQKHGR
jgi:hypothetical protein